jgi:integrase
VRDATRDDPVWFSLYLVALTSGMRPGELRALRWSDLDLARSLVVVQRTMTKDADGHVVVGETTKTKRPRAVALPALAVEALVVRQLIEEPAADAYVFARRDGPLPLTPGSTITTGSSGWLAVRPITLHQIRHTNATLDLEAGINPKIVAERLGHRSIETTLVRYSHVSIDLQQSAADAFAARVLGEGEGAS